MNKLTCLSAAALLSLSCNSFAAETPVMEKSIPLDWALTAAQAALKTCTEMGFTPAITIVDQKALPKVQLVMEGAFPHTVETSKRKAVTAASRQIPSSEVISMSAHEPELGAVFNAIGLTTLTGGIPIVHQGTVIGGIGIASAPGEDESGRGYDDICAEAGIKSIRKYLK